MPTKSMDGAPALGQQPLVGADRFVSHGPALVGSRTAAKVGQGRASDPRKALTEFLKSIRRSVLLLVAHDAPREVRFDS